MNVQPSPSTPPESLIELRDALRRFATEREWDQFHSPRNLATALIVEAAELLEHFQWLSDAAQPIAPGTLAEIRLEMADVLLYLVRLADRLDIDLAEAARDKLAINARKYPVEKARGSSRKYDKL
jgi:NTP pyrophosphatase (non-canonical NTP hydrolase)